MSLIQDALKKAQQEREKERDGFPVEDNLAPSPPPRTFALSNKRIIFYGVFLGALIIVSVLVGVFYKPSSTSTMVPTRRAAGEPPKTQGNETDRIKSHLATRRDALTDKYSPAKTSPTANGTSPTANGTGPTANGTMPATAGTPPHTTTTPPTAAGTTPPTDRVQTPPAYVTPPHSTAAGIPPTTRRKTPPVSRENMVKTQPPPQPKPVRQVQPETTRWVEPKKQTVSMPARPKSKKKKVKNRIKARALPDKKKKEKAGEAAFNEALQEGDGFREQRNFVMAAGCYKKALKLKRSVSVYMKLYGVFRGMKNKVLARAYIEDGLKHFPDSFSLNKTAAVLQIRDKDYGRALKLIDTALKQNNNDYALLTYKGLCYFHKNKYEQALLSFRDSLVLNDEAVENYYYIALIYDNSRDYPRALEFYHVFARLNPQGKNFKHSTWVSRRIGELQAYLSQSKKRE